MTRLAPLLVAGLAAVSLVAGAAAHTAVPPPDGFTLLNITAKTKLLVVAPHPDDESLGAAGLMQRVQEMGGQVRVVFLTDGDGYRDGVRREEHRRWPQPKDYRGYGRRREREARTALSTLGLTEQAGTFLSFPDQGLRRLLTTYWSERRAAFRSPYTRLDRPPRDEIVVADTEYRGEDLSQELAQIIGDYRPTQIVVPRRSDQHPDHCASWFFLMDAVGDVERVHADYTPDIVTYIVHWYSWPFENNWAHIEPPSGLRAGASGWIDLSLTDAERRVKRTALHQYRTQLDTMAWFLDGFARANEIFSRPAPARVVLPLRSNPCSE